MEAIFYNYIKFGKTPDEDDPQGSDGESGGVKPGTGVGN